jgi:hypothetical protein
MECMVSGQQLVESGDDAVGPPRQVRVDVAHEHDRTGPYAGFPPVSSKELPSTRVRKGVESIATQAFR